MELYSVKMELEREPKYLQFEEKRWLDVLYPGANRGIYA